MRRWRIGDVTISCIVERDLHGLMHMVVPDATRERVLKLPWLMPHFVDYDGNLQGSVQALIIEASGRRIIVDTCIGENKDWDKLLPMWSRLQNGFLRRLEDAGFPAESFDSVLCTHLHGDHMGWNTMRVDGKWVPTFKKARYLFGRVAFEADRARAREAAPDDAMAQAFNTISAESMMPVVEAGLVDFVETDHLLCPEVRLEPTPGHAAGHVSVRIASRGEEALITGDFIHHPCQFAHPEWASGFDDDPAQSTATRRRMFGALAGTPTLVIGTHFAAPTAGRVVRDGDAYRLDV